MGYGKLNEQGYLMSSQNKHDDTWSPLEEFEGAGQTAKYFKEDKTIDTYKEAQVDSINKYHKDMADLDGIIVMYEGNSFFGARSDQISLASTITKLKNKTKTTKWYTTTGQKLDMTSTQLEEILDLIDIQHDIVLAD